MRLEQHQPWAVRMDRPNHSLPYEEGKTLTLSVNQVLPEHESTFEVKILRFIQPSTLSCVMEVKSLATSGPTQYLERLILKLYDWRYATQLRQDHMVDPWAQSHEDAYREYVENGDAAKFLASSDDETDDEPWDTSQNEAYLFEFSRGLHQCEVKAYGYLKDLQGKIVPRFFANVHVNAFSMKNVLFEAQGIVIEFINGYSLSDLAKNEPQSAWQSICDKAIRAVNLIGDHQVLNEDVKPHNILIQQQATLPKHKVVIIDFAQCRFRGDYELEADWKHEKCRQDEEGAIGYVMAHKLKGAVEYKPSYRYHC